MSPRVGQAPPRQRVVLHVPVEVLAAMDARTQSLGLSRNEWCNRALRAALDQPVSVRRIAEHL